MRTPFFFAITACTLFLLCSAAMAQSPEAVPPPTGAPGVTIPADISDKDLDLWGQKVSAYAQAINSVKSYTQLADDFFAWEKNRESGKKSGVNAPPRWGATAPLLSGSGLDAAVKKNAGISLSFPAGDRALERLAGAAVALKESSEEVKRYFDRGGDIEDAQGVKLQELSAPMREHYAAVTAARDTLNAVHEQAEYAVSEQSLNRFEKKYGRKYQWQNRITMRKARAIMRTLENVPQIDKAEFDGAAREFKTALDGFDAYCDRVGEQGLKKEVLRNPVTPKDFDQFLTAVRSLQSSVDENKSQHDIVRAANGVVSAYNSLVNVSNRTVFIQQ